jgi:hypothetical protein
MRAWLAAAFVALGLVLVPAASSTGLAGTGLASSRTAGMAPKGGCPAAWRAGWQKLANRIEAPVYCPTWMPNPLDAKIGGQYIDIDSVAKDRSYLISFLEHGDAGSGDVHVNFRGYPGSTAIPRCKTVIPNGTKTIRGKTACFSGEAGVEAAPGIRATVYRVNQDADQWHILLAWKHGGSLYTVSEHVIKPFGNATVVLKNLRRVLRGLVLVQPEG